MGINKNKTVLTAILAIVFLGWVQPFTAAAQEEAEKLLKDANGSELKEIIDSYRGEKVVLVNVWATWCGPCREEFPHIVKLQNKYRDQLQVVFISTDFKRETALDFLREQGVDWTTYYNTEKSEVFIESLSEDWTGAMPYTKIIDKEGSVVASWENSASLKRFEKNVKIAINN